MTEIAYSAMSGCLASLRMAAWAFGAMAGLLLVSCVGVSSAYVGEKIVTIVLGLVARWRRK